MSLVAYGASDDSDASETDEKDQKEEERHSHVASGDISDEDEFEAVSSTSSASAFMTGKNSHHSQSSQPHEVSSLLSDSTVSSVNSAAITSLQDLPEPQLRAQESNINEEEDELEEEVKVKASEIADAPKPPPKKSKQPVKITIPSLEEFEESEESETRKKQTLPSKKTGLFSLLPAPIHSAKKEINRPLIPHSVSKKPPAQKNSGSQSNSKLPTSTSSHVATSSTETMSSKRATPFNALTGYDSDSEEDDDKGSTSNFFALDSEKNLPEDEKEKKLSNRLQSEEISSSESLTKDTANVTEEESNSGAEAEQEEEETGPEPGALNDAPLDFQSVNRLNAWSASSGFLSPVGPAGPISYGSFQAVPYSSLTSPYGLPSNSQYNMVDSHMMEQQMQEEPDEVPNDDLKQFMSDKEFQRLQGKRKRGSEEVISFVDANVDDYVDPLEVSKHLTEETEYVSHRNKDNLPTSQQKRKKQITYLAHQAKEHELMLKNTWSQNRMTKKQTQSKYGF